MNTPYERFDEEARQEWLLHPVTEAFLATLRAYREQVAAGLIERMKSPIGDADHWNHIYGGEIRGLDFVLGLPDRGGRIRHGR